MYMYMYMYGYVYVYVYAFYKFARRETESCYQFASTKMIQVMIDHMFCTKKNPISDPSTEELTRALRSLNTASLWLMEMVSASHSESCNINLIVFFFSAKCLSHIFD